MALEGHISIMVTRALIPIYLAILFLLEPFKSTETDAFLFWKSQIKHQKPHIIVILADDVGRNDFGIFGSNQIFTPNIDALGYNGIVLDRFYTESVCTPSRAAFLTGKYPTRMGLQGVPVESGEDVSIPLDMPTMAEQLRKLGYNTHMIGKWHLGAARRVNTPNGRGFDTHYGYWYGFTGYFDHYISTPINDSVLKGLDFFDQYEPQWSSQGQYATELFTKRAIEIIHNHKKKDPLFLYVAHLASHTGENGTELHVPDVKAANEKYKHIRDPKRRLYAEVTSIMDDSVGQIVKTLKNEKMLENSIILFMSDNGAETLGTHANSGSNWPLRGTKFTNFEGVVRGTGIVFSPLFKLKGYINQELIHISDWLPTFYSIAGGNLADLGKIDGINQWETLSKNLPSKRTEILIDINEIEHMTAIITKEHHKLVKYVNGSSRGGIFEQYSGDSGRESGTPPYNIEAVLESDVNVALGQSMSPKKIHETRNKLDLAWCRDSAPFLNCSTPCLFDLEVDPCETTNLVKTLPHITYKLQQRLGEFCKKLVPQQSPGVDPASNPKYYNNTWCTWLDDKLCPKTPFFK